MDYEVVVLKEKTVAGLGARTSNTSPDMGAVIGGLWQRFYGEDIYSGIPDKKNGKSMGIYTDYENDETGSYTIFVGCEVTGTKGTPAQASVRTLPGGKYAKFVVKGDMHAAVAAFWQELWQMDLPRSFVCDFEEYQNSDMENAEIHIYIGLKD